jgi:hypothetical protein
MSMIKNIFEMLLEEREVKRRRLDGSKGVGSMNMPINSVDEVKAWDEYVKEKVRATAHMF